FQRPSEAVLAEARHELDTPSLVELDALARAEAQSSSTRHWGGERTRANRLENSEFQGDRSAGVPATTMLADIFGALSIPMTTSEAQRLGYQGPTYTETSVKDSASPQGTKT
ncbi:hypothetical protein FRC10_007474, partial [Ceratobasidium sp. 414]